MGSFASSGGQFHISNASSLMKFQNLHYYSIKQYDVSGQWTDHHEIQILVSNAQKYQLVRLSYSEKGLLIRPLSPSKRFQKQCKRQRCFRIKSMSYIKQKSYQKIYLIACKYARNKFSFLTGRHCQGFCQQVQKQLNAYSYREKKQIWDIYDQI